MGRRAFDLMPENIATSIKERMRKLSLPICDIARHMPYRISLSTVAFDINRDKGCPPARIKEYVQVVERLEKAKTVRDKILRG